jgi:hypothetical protein
MDFLSIGTNDLIQYTLAIDRVDYEVAHLYNPLHPAVLQLIAMTIAAGHKAGIDVAVCGEMAGDVKLTRLLLGMGLREFSMHPAQLLSVKQEILNSDLTRIMPQPRKILRSMEPNVIADAVEQLAVDVQSGSEFVHRVVAAPALAVPPDRWPVGPSLIITKPHGIHRIRHPANACISPTRCALQSGARCATTC